MGYVFKLKKSKINEIRPKLKKIGFHVDNWLLPEQFWDCRSYPTSQTQLVLPFEKVVSLKPQIIQLPSLVFDLENPILHSNIKCQHLKPNYYCCCSCCCCFEKVFRAIPVQEVEPDPS